MVTRDIGRFKGLFFETSAQIVRLLSGSPQMVRGIDDLIEAIPEVGSSRFVLSEFMAVVGGLYSSVANAIEQLDGPNRQRSILDLWKEVVEVLPYYVPGGG